MNSGLQLYSYYLKTRGKGWWDKYQDQPTWTACGGEREKEEGYIKGKREMREKIGKRERKTL